MFNVVNVNFPTKICQENKSPTSRTQKKKKQKTTGTCVKVNFSKFKDFNESFLACFPENKT